MNVCKRDKCRWIERHSASLPGTIICTGRHPPDENGDDLRLCPFVPIDKKRDFCQTNEGYLDYNLADLRQIRLMLDGQEDVYLQEELQKQLEEKRESD